MTDHKYTDDEIIHSLQVCSNDGDCSECLINPHKGNYGYCTSLAIKAALDLINRQKNALEREIYNGLKADEEIEHLKVELDAMRGAANSYKMHYEEVQAEIERLKELTAEKQNLTEQWQNKAGELLAEKQIIKAEAIKEFAERLIEKCDAPHWCVWMSEIQDLVKEMTEGNNE